MKKKLNIRRCCRCHTVLLVYLKKLCHSNSIHWHIFLTVHIMKKDKWVFTVLVAFTALLLAFTLQSPTGSIRGRVVPFNAALHVWAVSDKDTANSVIQNGAFEIKGLKEGRYRLIVDGRRPYKTTTKLDVVVNSGTATDVGDIILDQ